MRMGATAGELGFLELHGADGVASRVPLREGLVIGRSAEADVMLDSPGASRRHALVERDANGRWWIRDLGSRNGTLVNGVPVQVRHLHHGDDITICDTLLQVSLTGEPPPRRDLHSGFHVAATIQADAPQTLTVNTLADMGSPKVDTRHLFALQRFNRRLIETPKREDRLRLLCELMIGEEMHGRYAATLRLPPASQPTAAADVTCGPIAAERGGAPFHLSQTVLRCVASQREPVLASNTTSRKAALELSIAAAAQPISVIACPLQGDGGVAEVLYVVVPSRYGTGEWLALSALAADQHDQADEYWSARRRAEATAALEHDLDRAREVQMGLLPRDLAVPGLDVALHFQPCRGVGGDYVDVVPMEDGRVMLTIADVCGKGMQAALVSATVHTAVRAAVFMGRSLAEWMTILNAFLGDRLPAGSFVTMIAAAIDPETGEMEMVNAGHPPAIVVGGDCTGRVLGIGGNLPLGIEAAPLTSQRARLEPGDWLALYTDGLTEIVGNDGKWLGSEGLAARLAELCAAEAAASEVSQRLVGVLNDVSTDDAGDDRTFLIVRRRVSS